MTPEPPTTGLFGFVVEALAVGGFERAMLDVMALGDGDGARLAGVGLGFLFEAGLGLRLTGAGLGLRPRAAVPGALGGTVAAFRGFETPPLPKLATVVVPRPRVTGVVTVVCRRVAAAPPPAG